MRSIAIVLLLSATAHAQLEDEPTPIPPPPGVEPAGLSDATLRAVGERPIIMRTCQGAELAGRILSVEPATVTLALTGSEAVVTVMRADIVQLRLQLAVQHLSLLDAEQPTTVARVAAEPKLRERHFSLNLGIPPAIDVDFDYGLFYAFTNASLVFPAATAGQLAAFSIGAGVNFRLAKNSRWKMEIFGYVAPARLNLSDDDDDDSSSTPWAVGFGVGIGLHYTMTSGFTVGFKVPILGYAAGSTGGGSGAGVSTFYLASAMGLPLVSLGYRF